jgi:hypothetical protein
MTAYEELTEFAKKAKALCQQAKEGEKSTLALGKHLLAVQAYIKENNICRGEMRRWIRAYVGRDVSTLNRCNYAMSLANPNSKRHKKERHITKSKHARLLSEINTALRGILRAVETGELAGRPVGKDRLPNVSTNRETIVSAVDELVKLAEYMAFKKNRKDYLSDIARYGKTLEAQANGEMLLAREFPEQPEKAAAAHA